MTFFKKIFVLFCKSIVKSFPMNKARIWALNKIGGFVGKKVYLGTEMLLVTETGYDTKLIIEDRVSIGPRLTVLLASGSNNSKLLKRYPLEYGNIVIEEDCWIGANVTIFPNVKIGKCSIVASGAVVNKDVEPYSIVGGVPAKMIKKIEKID